MNNPFDLANYKPQLKFTDLEKARRNAYQAARHVNEERKKGREPSNPYAERNNAHTAGLPQDYAVEMPKMELHKRSIYHKTRGKND